MLGTGHWARGGVTQSQGHAVPAAAPSLAVTGVTYWLSRSVTRENCHDSFFLVVCQSHVYCLPCFLPVDDRMFRYLCHVVSPYLDDPADDELAALGAAGRVQDVEAVLAVLAALELEEDVVLEGSEALGADEAAVAEELAVAVHDLRLGLEAVLAARAGDAV